MSRDKQSKARKAGSPSQLQTADRSADGRFAPGNKAGKRFQPGQSGNPGGNFKRSPKISHIYARLLALSPDELKSFKPVNAAEEIALKQIKNAQTGNPSETLSAAKEITDRVEGRASQRIHVDNTSELERLITRVRERVFAQAGIKLSRDEAIERIVTYRPELAEYMS